MPVKRESALLNFPSWQHRFESALCETDNVALFKKVEVAESAMLARRDVLTGVVERREECEALDAAVVALRVFEERTVGFLNRNLPLPHIRVVGEKGRLA